MISPSGDPVRAMAPITKIPLRGTSGHPISSRADRIADP